MLLELVILTRSFSPSTISQPIVSGILLVRLVGRMSMIALCLRIELARVTMAVKEVARVGRHFR